MKSITAALARTKQATPTPKTPSDGKAISLTAPIKTFSAANAKTIPTPATFEACARSRHPKRSSKGILRHGPMLLVKNTKMLLIPWFSCAAFVARPKKTDSSQYTADNHQATEQPFSFWVFKNRSAIFSADTPSKNEGDEVIHEREYANGQITIRQRSNRQGCSIADPHPHKKECKRYGRQRCGAHRKCAMMLGHFGLFRHAKPQFARIPSISIDLLQVCLQLPTTEDIGWVFRVPHNRYIIRKTD